MQLIQSLSPSIMSRFSHPARALTLLAFLGLTPLATQAQNL
ncbi:MAG: hypothetical protein ACI9BH_002838, partial [Paracoccaceae bacterium]